MAVLKFYNKIYKKEAVCQAVSAFSHLGEFKIKYNKNYIEVKVDINKSGNKTEVIKEFNNYVLGLTRKYCRIR